MCQTSQGLGLKGHYSMQKTLNCSMFGKKVPFNLWKQGLFKKLLKYCYHDRGHRMRVEETDNTLFLH